MSSTDSPPASPELFCIICGYNQRGIIADRCPECGQSYAKTPPSPVRIPWFHRRHLGRLKAFWRTAGLVIFRKNEFCQQIDRPIRLRDARLFWLLAILQAWLPLVGAVLLLYPAPAQAGLAMELYEALYERLFIPVPFAVFILIGLLLFFASATGMPSYFCHPRALPIDRQNNAIALSYFASAPIALMPLIVALLIAAQLLSHLSVIPTILNFLAALIALLMLGTWYIRTLGIVLMLSARPRWKLTVVALTFSWLFLLVLCLIIIPLSIWYAAAAIHNLF